MSHNTEPDRAVRRHPGPIIGIVIVLIVTAVAAVWLTRTDPPPEAPVAIDNGADSQTQKTPPRQAE